LLAFGAVAIAALSKIDPNMVRTGEYENDPAAFLVMLGDEKPMD
jgi:hypothetical protein